MMHALLAGQQKGGPVCGSAARAKLANPTMECTGVTS
jgi:hypothetical protein